MYEKDSQVDKAHGRAIVGRDMVVKIRRIHFRRWSSTERVLEEDQ